MNNFSSVCVELWKKNWGEVVDCDYSFDFRWDVERADVAWLPNSI